MCTHYHVSKQGQCDHDRADPPEIKENANFCEYFKPEANVFRSESRRDKESAESELADLFGDDVADSEVTGSDVDIKAGETGSPDHARSRLDDLFDD